MARRVNGLRDRKGGNKVGLKVRLEALDYHEGLSFGQVKIILREFGLGDKFKQFSEWMYGQTAPLIYRTDEKGKIKTVGGVYEYDLFRYIDWQQKGIIPVFD